MNDFTKKELKHIYWQFEYYIECLEPKFGKPVWPEKDMLMHKIKSMIENYDTNQKIMVRGEPRNLSEFDNE